MARSAKRGGKRRSATTTLKASSAKGRTSPAKTKRAIGSASRLKRSTASNNELKEAREQQAATAEILKVISQSTFDLQGVLEALVKSAVRLCDADTGIIRRREGDIYPVAATFGFTEEERAYFARYSVKADGGSVFGRAILERRSVHVPDLLADRDLNRDRVQDYARVVTIRSGLGVPLLREGGPIGVFTLQRRKRRPFTQKQIELVETFANQAVIAIENTRLFNETQEALDRQTATANILRVIAGSPTDVQPVFDAIAKSTKHLLASHTAVVTRVIDGVVHLAASTAESEAPAHAAQGLLPYPLSSDQIHARVARTGKVAVNTDAPSSDLPQEIKDFARTVGWRSMLVVPMLRNGIAIGTIGITRREAGSFDEKTVDLLKTFADQAVIAIENARLLNELRTSRCSSRPPPPTCSRSSVDRPLICRRCLTRLPSSQRDFAERIWLPLFVRKAKLAIGRPVTACHPIAANIS